MTAQQFRDVVAYVVNHAEMSDAAYAILVKAIEDYDKENKKPQQVSTPVEAP